VKHESACWRASLNPFRQRFEIHLPLLELGDETDEIREIATETVQAPDYEGIAFAEALEAGLQLRSGGVLSARLVLVDLPAFRTFERVSLQIERLVFGGDTSVANPHVPNVNRAAYIDFRTNCETILPSQMGLILTVLK